MAVKTTSRAEAMSAKIREARDSAGFNNTELADAAGLPRRSVVRLTNGRNVPHEGTLEKLAAATGKPLSFFAVDAGLQRITSEQERIVDALLPFAQLVADLVVEARASVPPPREEVEAAA